MGFCGLFIIRRPQAAALNGAVAPVVPLSPADRRAPRQGTVSPLRSKRARVRPQRVRTLRRAAACGRPGPRRQAPGLRDRARQGCQRPASRIRACQAAGRRTRGAGAVCAVCQAPARAGPDPVCRVRRAATPRRARPLPHARFLEPNAPRGGQDGSAIGARSAPPFSTARSAVTGCLPVSSVRPGPPRLRSLSSKN